MVKPLLQLSLTVMATPVMVKWVRSGIALMAVNARRVIVILRKEYTSL